MRSSRNPALLAGLVLVAVAAVAVAGCGSDSSSSSASTAGGGESTSTSTSTSASGQGADVAAAEKALKPYIGHFSPPLLVDEPLKKAPSADSKFSALQLASPIGGLLAELESVAAKTAGVDLSLVKAGSSASTAQAAAETVASQRPDSLFLPPFEPSIISNQLAEMHENGTFIIGQGIFEAEKYGIEGNVSPPEQLEEFGRLFADWAVSKHGDETNVVLFEHPELSFAAAMKEAFLGEMKKLCPECEATTVGITADEASASANRIVSELQSNPDINQVVAISDLVKGLPAAMKAGGLDVGTFVYPGEPQALEYIKNGEIEGTIATGLGYQAFVEMDMALRNAQGMELTKGEEAGIQPTQILGPKDITFDPSQGWEPDPNFAETFAKFWAGE